MRAGYAFVAWIARTYYRSAYGLEISGLQNLPKFGPLIIASNHRSNSDPPIVGSVMTRECSFFAKEELFRTRLLGPLIRYLNAFPVRRGEFDRQALKNCLHILKQDGALIFFPEGTRAPSGGFLKAKLGIGWIVALSDAPVVPVYVHGTPVKGIRVRHRPAIRIVVGEAVTAAELMADLDDGRESYKLIADRILERIRDLSLTTPGGAVSFEGTSLRQRYHYRPTITIKPQTSAPLTLRAGILKTGA